MPIYEYFCKDCNVIFNFMSAKVAPLTVPDCPKCHSRTLTKILSTFASRVLSKNESAAADENRIEKAFSTLLQDAEAIRGGNDKDTSALMEMFTKECGFNYSDELVSSLAEDNSAGMVTKENVADLLVSLNQQNANDKPNKTSPEVDPTLYHM